jgi:hypothetical protein
MPVFLLSFLAKDGFKLIAVLALFSALAYGEHRFHKWEKSLVQQGYDEARKEDDAKQSIANEKAERLLITANNAIAQSQQEIQNLSNQLALRAKELQDAKEERQKLVADYAAGLKRMSVRTIGGANCEGGNSKQNSSSSASHGSNEGRSELVPEVSADILDFAGRYQDNVRNLDICIDAYNGMREQLNKDEK